MKIDKIKVKDNEFRVLCADIFSTNDELKAMIMFEYEDIDIFKISGIYNSFEICGSFFTHSDMHIDESTFGTLYIDVDYATDNIARAYINTGFNGCES